MRTKAAKKGGTRRNICGSYFAFYRVSNTLFYEESTIRRWMAASTEEIEAWRKKEQTKE